MGTKPCDAHAEEPHAERPAHKDQPKKSGNETVLNAKLRICEGCSAGWRGAIPLCLLFVAAD